MSTAMFPHPNYVRVGIVGFSRGFRFTLIRPLLTQLDGKIKFVLCNFIVGMVR